MLRFQLPHRLLRVLQSACNGIRGAIAQLGERYNGIVEVGGSIPPGSTKSVPFV